MYIYYAVYYSIVYYIIVYYIIVDYIILCIYIYIYTHNVYVLSSIMVHKDGPEEAAAVSIVSALATAPEAAPAADGPAAIAGRRDVVGAPPGAKDCTCSDGVFQRTFSGLFQWIVSCIFQQKVTFQWHFYYGISLL